jgi:dTDP-L-rhamnose 4-epimerase
VDAIVACLERDAPGACMNVGSGEATTVRSLAESLRRAMGSDVPVTVTGEYRAGDVRHCVADIRRARELLEFHPRVGLEAGLAGFCAWVKRQHVERDRSGEAAHELALRGLMPSS